MANEHEHGGHEKPAAGGGGPSKDLAKLRGWWKEQPTWEKAGVMIGAAALVVAIFMYMKNRQSAGAPTSTDTGGMSAAQPVGYPGEGDTYPSVPTAPTTPPTTGGTTTGGTTTTKPPVATPIPAPLKPILPVRTINPIPAPKPKLPKRTINPPAGTRALSTSNKKTIKRTEDRIRQTSSGDSIYETNNPAVTGMLLRKLSGLM